MHLYCAHHRDRAFSLETFAGLVGIKMPVRIEWQNSLRLHKKKTHPRSLPDTESCPLTSPCAGFPAFRGVTQCHERSSAAALPSGQAPTEPGRGVGGLLQPSGRSASSFVALKIPQLSMAVLCLSEE